MPCRPYTRWGFDPEADDFFWFVADLAEQDEQLQVVYQVDGERDIAEHTLDHLHGFEGARPVRIGNAAYTQRQHDVWGSVARLVLPAHEDRDRLDGRLWPIVERLVEQAVRHWREPDCGIWEVRTEPRHYTFSKAMCWVAADRGARLADVREDWDCAARWQEAANPDPRQHLQTRRQRPGVFTQHYDTDKLDASVVLLPLFRFLPATDPRIRATVLAVARGLSVGGLIMRYKVDETEDGLKGQEDFIHQLLLLVGVRARRNR